MQKQQTLFMGQLFSSFSHFFINAVLMFVQLLIYKYILKEKGPDIRNVHKSPQAINSCFVCVTMSIVALNSNSPNNVLC